jgi:transposase
MQGEPRYLLFVGDDWAEDHHDVEIQDETGRKLAARRLPEGAAGIARLHELIAVHLAADGDPGQVVVAIETDRGLWVQALAAAGYQVFGLNPKQVARFKERYSLSGKKDDAADAHALADMVRAERHQLRAVAAGTAGAQAVKVAARAHQTLIFRTYPAHAAAALGAAGVLPRRAGGLRGPGPDRR